MDDSLTVFCPFTRAWAVAPFFRALGASDVPFTDAAFVAYVDSNDEQLLEAVSRAAEALPFRSAECHLSGRRPIGDGRGPRPRRERHAMMREDSKALVGEGRLLLLEDDTLIPTDTFSLLSETARDCDWVIGAEVGRWGETHPPGVWRITTGDGAWKLKEAILPGEAATEQADATGFYCVLTSAAVYREADFSAWHDALSLDVHATWRLTLTGRRLMVDWRVPCVHLTETGRLTMADATPYARSLVGCEHGRLQSIGGNGGR